MRNRSLRIHAGLLAAFLILASGACDRGPKPEQPPVVRPADMTVEAWTDAWRKAVEITGELTQGSSRQTWGYTDMAYRTYSPTVIIRNTSDYDLESGDNLFVIEARDALVSPKTVLVIAGGTFVKTPPENYSGSVEFRGSGKEGRGAADNPFAVFSTVRAGHEEPDDMGLYNSQTCLEGGGMFRNIPPLLQFTMGGGEDDSKDAFENIPRGEERKIETELQLSVMVLREYCDKAWVLTPEMTARDRDGESLSFRGMLEFAPRVASDEASGEGGWELVSSRFLPMTAETVVPLLDDTAAPLWQRVFASYWAYRWPEASAAALHRIASAAGTENEALRAGAIRSLGKIRHEESFALLHEMVRDANAFPRTRGEAVRALGRLGNFAATPDIIALAKKSDDVLSDDAVKALGDMGDRAAVEPLLAMLRSNDREDDHSAVADSLSRLADENTIGPLAEIARGSRKGADDAIVALGKVRSGPAVAALTAMMPGVDASKRTNICAALGENDTPEALEALVAALEDKDADVRAAAASALGGADTDARAAALVAALDHKDEKVREAAVEGLAGHKRLEGRARIAAMAADAEEKEEVRTTAIKAMSVVPEEGTGQALIGLAQDSKAGIRAAALQSLGKLGSVEARAAIIQALGDKESDVRVAAAWSFRKMGKTDDFAPFIQALLAEKESSVLTAEVGVLIALDFKDLSYLPAIADRLAALDEDGREQIQRLLEHMSGNKDIKLKSGAKKAEIEASVQKWKDWHAGRTQAEDSKE